MSTHGGRRGLIVGVSSERSLGFACARHLAALGAEVVATYRPDPSREHLPGALRAIGCADALPLDPTAEGGIERLFSDVAARSPRLDFLIHTLVHIPPGVLGEPLVSLERSAFDRVMHAGVFSLVELCRHARELLCASDAPRVVTLTSESSRLATPNYHVAGICKGALESAVYYLALELGASRIAVNAVSAGAVDTDGARAVVGEGAIAKTRAHLEKRSMLRRATEPDDVARAVAWLAGPEAANITGQIVTVDGGFSRAYF